MIQIDNTPDTGATFMCVHFPPGSYSSIYYRFTNLTTGLKVFNALPVGAMTNNRGVEFTIATNNVQDGMHLLEFMTAPGGTPVTTLLGYASAGGNTAVPSDPSTYTGGDSDVYKVYYE
jgi:hypothetical protein